MKKILVVEDDANMRKLLVDEFNRQGFKTAEASNGEEGLQLVLDFKPDSIVLDIIMPVMNGAQMLEALRKEEWGKNIPVTILTNASDLGMIATALERGVCKYIIKSDVAIDDIVKKVADEIK